MGRCMGERKCVGDFISFSTDGEPKQGVVRYITEQREYIGTESSLCSILQEGYVVESGCGEFWWVPVGTPTEQLL